MEKKDILRRLAFAKYLLSVAIRHSEQREPLAQASILTFHDAVELFLALAADNFDIKDKITEFKDYWSRIDLELAKNGKALGQKRAMTRLNTSRVNLKHHGIMPNIEDVSEFKSSVIEFFEENTPITFGFEFKEASMLNLITNDAVKGILEEAANLKPMKMFEAMAKVGTAFDKLMADFETQLFKDYLFSPFSRNRVSSFSVDYGKNADEDLVDSVKEIADATGELQKVVKIIGLGIQYKDYIQFRMLVPPIELVGRKGVEIEEYMCKNQFSEPYFEWCFQFVIETAIHLQTHRLNVPPSDVKQQSLEDIFE